MPASNTASEILAYCGNCKMDLSAIIVAKVGAKIAKVQCKTCKKERAYKPPKGATSPGDEAPAKKKRAAKSTTAADAAKTVSIEAEWTRLMGEIGHTNRAAYSPQKRFKQADVISHPSFGDGVVTRVIHPNKMEVLFKSDLKLLIHSPS